MVSPTAFQKDFEKQVSFCRQAMSEQMRHISASFKHNMHALTASNCPSPKMVKH